MSQGFRVRVGDGRYAKPNEMDSETVQNQFRTGFRAGPCCRWARPCFALVYHYLADGFRGELETGFRTS